MTCPTTVSQGELYTGAFVCGTAIGLTILAIADQHAKISLTLT